MIRFGLRIPLLRLFAERFTAGRAGRPSRDVVGVAVRALAAREEHQTQREAVHRKAVAGVFAELGARELAQLLPRISPGDRVPRAAQHEFDRREWQAGIEIQLIDCQLLAQIT